MPNKSNTRGGVDLYFDNEASQYCVYACEIHTVLVMGMRLLAFLSHIKGNISECEVHMHLCKLKATEQHNPCECLYRTF